MPSRPVSTVEQLARCSDAFDQVLREASAGPMAPRTYNRLEAETQRIAKAMVAAFRGECG